MARLIWTEPALADLEAIADYMALDKPDAAARYVRHVFAAVERLARFPKSGIRVPELPHLPYRQVIVPPCNCTIFCASASPSPLPGTARVESA